MKRVTDRPQATIEEYEVMCLKGAECPRCSETDRNYMIGCTWCRKIKKSARRRERQKERAGGSTHSGTDTGWEARQYIPGRAIPSQSTLKGIFQKDDDQDNWNEDELPSEITFWRSCRALHNVAEIWKEIGLTDYGKSTLTTSDLAASQYHQLAKASEYLMKVIELNKVKGYDPHQHRWIIPMTGMLFQEAAQKILDFIGVSDIDWDTNPVVEAANAVEYKTGL